MKNIVAFFDMDYTILSESSGMLFMRYLWRQGDVSPGAMLRAYWYAFVYKLGALDYPEMAARLASTVAERSESETKALCQRWFDEMGVHYIAENAVRRMEQHRAQGHLVTIISASTPGVVGPVALHLGVEDYLCTRLEVIDGSFTGRIIEPACYAAGKVHWAEQYAIGHGANLGEAHFYSDGYSDLPLLEVVGHPVAVNPDRRLLALAQVRGWPIERFH